MSVRRKTLRKIKNIFPLIPKPLYLNLFANPAIFMRRVSLAGLFVSF